MGEVREQFLRWKVKYVNLLNYLGTSDAKKDKVFYFFVFMGLVWVFFVE